MRIAALILGIIGSFVLWWATFWIAALGGLGGSSGLVVVGYAIPIAALVGACLAIKYPGVAAALQLGAVLVFWIIVGVGPVSIGFSALVIIAGVLALFGRQELSALGGTPAAVQRPEGESATPADTRTNALEALKQHVVPAAAATFRALRTWFSNLSARTRWLGLSGAAALVIVLPILLFLAVDNARYCQSVVARLDKVGERLGALFSPSRPMSAVMFSDPLRPFPIKLTQRVLIFDPVTARATLHVETYDAASGAARLVIIDGKGVPIRLVGTIDANAAHLTSEDGKMRYALTRQGDSLVGAAEVGPGTLNEIELDLSSGLAAARKQTPAGGCEDPRTLPPVVVAMEKAGSMAAATEAHTLSDPPYQIVDRDLCPGEGCVYRIEWRAKTDVKAYSAPPERIGVDLVGVESKIIPAGKWVTSVTGVVLAKRGVGRIKRAVSASLHSPALAQGQLVAIYSALGEGCYRSWLNGAFGVVCDVAPISEVPNDHWVEFRLADGSSAWTNAHDAFVSRDELNDKLGQAIQNEKTPLSEKLRKVDALLKDGAQLNGSAGKYGLDPAYAAFSSNDVEMIKALVKKGLSLSDTKHCPAHSIAQSALAPNGDIALEYFLANGLSLDCLGSPPLMAFLGFGIASKDYAADRAMAVARILIAHGADVSATDSQGHTVFDLLAKGDAERVALLRQMLEQTLRENATGGSAKTKEEFNPNKIFEQLAAIEAGARPGLTTSEMDALRRQVAKCWMLAVGAPDPAKLVFRLKLFLNEDGTVAAAPQLLDQGGLSDVYFRAAVNSAIRAVSICGPYKIPPGRYDAWREIVVTFDPREMADY